MSKAGLLHKPLALLHRHCPVLARRTRNPADPGACFPTALGSTFPLKLLKQVRWFSTPKDEKSLEVKEEKELSWKDIEHGEGDVEFDSQLMRVKVQPYQPPRGGVVVLWDLEQKPPVNATAVESLKRLKALASMYGNVRGIYAFTCEPMDTKKIDVTPTEQQLQEWHQEGKEFVGDQGWGDGEMPRSAQMMHGRR
jgi:hypothetical protein